MIKGIIRGKAHKPRTVLYGPPKIGKSTFGADAPSPIFVTTEDGVDNVPVDQFGKASSWDVLMSNVKEIAEGDHTYKTLVIDTINGAAELAAQHVCKSQFKDNWGPGGFQSFGQGWAATSEEMRKLLSLLDVVRGRGMYVLLLAHTGVQNVKNPVDGDYSKYTPDLDKRVWARVSAWADVIGRAEYEHSIVEDRATKRSKAISDSTRVVHFAGTIAEDAGCRVGFDLPAELPLSWAEFEAALGGGEATMTQLRELWGLLSPDLAAKALSYLGIARLDDLAQAQSQRVRVILNRVQQLSAQNATTTKKEAA